MLCRLQFADTRQTLLMYSAAKMLSSTGTRKACCRNECAIQHAECMLAQVKEERNNLQRMVDELLDHEAPHGGGRARSSSPSKQSSLSTFRSAFITAGWHCIRIYTQPVPLARPLIRFSCEACLGCCKFARLWLRLAQLQLGDAGTRSTMVRTA